MTGPRIAARHPQNPTAKWERFQAAVREAAIRGAEARARTDRERKRGTDYARAAEARGKQVP